MIKDKLLDKNGNPSRLKKKANNDLLLDILSKYPSEDENTSIFMALHGIEAPKCSNCGKPLIIRNFKLGFVSTWCSSKCRDSDPLFKEKMRVALSSYDKEQSMEKRKKTNIEKYGVAFHSQRDEVKDIIKRAISSKREQIRETTKRKWIENFGTETPQNMHLSEECKLVLSSKEELEKLYSSGLSSDSIATKIGCSPTLVLLKLHKFGIDLRENKSGLEIQFEEFLKSLGVPYQTNKRILDGKEIDFLVENVGIELHGIFWHSSNPLCNKTHPKEINYHLDKFKKSKELGIKLIQIFEDEWTNRREACESLLLSSLKLNKRIFARLTEVRIISPKEAKMFCEKYHLSGGVYSKVNLGLFYENELISVMTFSKSRFEKDKTTWEIIRYCTKKGITVVGGASKLFKMFLKEASPRNVISYSDNRVGSGDVYNSLGFTKTKDVSPGYNWVVGGKRMNRALFQKSKLKDFDNFDLNKTEKEIMFEKGNRILYDAGHSKWIYHSDIY